MIEKSRARAGVITTKSMLSIAFDVEESASKTGVGYIPKNPRKSAIHKILAIAYEL
jgi:hypothetical protein